MRFANKVAVVTGGGSGIGRATVLAFAREGARVGVMDLDAKAADAVAREATEAGGQGLAVVADVANTEQVSQGMAKVAEQFGRIDILVNNAGWDKAMPFEQTDPALWDKVIAINYKGQLNCAHAVIPYMKEQQSGKIVNVASAAGQAGSSGEAVYSGAKGAVISFTKALAREMARHGVHVNCVAPGLCDTALLDSITAGNAKLVDAIVKAIPFRRLAKPEEIAPAILFMASDEASYITGQVLGVNGGLAM